MKCQAITQTGSPYELRAGKGGPCQREATYTDGQRYFCTQHSKEFATVLKKATNKVRDGLRPVPTDRRTAT
jgi:hypothetical protein